MDIRHAYIEKGSGEPLIMLHGNGESKEYFEHQIPYFAKAYRVIAPDTRGHGETPKGTKPFRIWQFAEDLKDFMDEKGYDDWGCSWSIRSNRNHGTVFLTVFDGNILYDELEHHKKN